MQGDIFQQGTVTRFSKTFPQFQAQILDGTLRDVSIRMKEIRRNSLSRWWTVEKVDGHGKSFNASVPCSLYDVLLKHGEIDDPFYGLNEHEVKWVFTSDWKFQVSFDLEQGFMEYPEIYLDLHGIDTISEVFLNGEKVGDTNNMHRLFRFEVKSHLEEGRNSLIIVIKSPTVEAMRLRKKHKHKLRTFQALPAVPYLRKAQYSFGWDWGPRLPDIGIWKPVELVAVDGLMLSNVYVEQHFNRSTREGETMNYAGLKYVTLGVTCDVDGFQEGIHSRDVQLHLEITSPSGKVIVTTTPVFQNSCAMEVEIHDPELWWTHDLGEPSLYGLKLELLHENTRVDEYTARIGLRDIELVREPDKWGESFYFKLNGVPIFAKGANWIPVDSFIPRGKVLGLYGRVLENAKEANMNMIRVWGGGIYEDDIFYDLCDELGILVWQDFTFACAVYPLHESFIDNVRLELIDNITRLRNHPSLALWCGNNEIEMLFLVEIVLSMIPPRDIRRFKKSYRYMFEEMFPSIVAELDPKTPYWPSSPSNGGGGRPRGLIKSNNPNFGDSHFWKVWHAGAPFSAYRHFDSRFMSEYGFESFPSMKTIRSFCSDDSQFSFDSRIMENHQKNMAGNKKIMKYMKRRFSVPPNFEKQVILSQITQAEAIEYGVEHWRRNRVDFHCMGSLYWQLNDCWPVASWSSLDYFGRWKALHYFARRFYQPIAGSVLESRRKIEFWVQNDLKTPFSGVLEWCVLESTGRSLLGGKVDFSVKSCHSKCLKEVFPPVVDGISEFGDGHIAFYKILGNDELVAIHQGFRLIGNPKNFKLEPPSLTYTIEPITENQVRVEVKVEKISLHIHLESETVDFVASDNYFSMHPGENKEIWVTLAPASDGGCKDVVKEFTNTLVIHSLFDLMKHG
ncbi:MAG: beta-mannosidase [Promethearchaeota archaeon]